MNWELWGEGDTKRRTSYPAQVLALVEERQGGRHCVFCKSEGLVTPANEPLEVDHRRPLSMGGDNSAWNLQFLCRGHNRARSNGGNRPRETSWQRRALRG